MHDGCSPLTVGEKTAVQSNPVAIAVARRNLMVMRQKWGELVAHTDKVLQDKLDKKVIGMEGVRHVLGALFSCAGKMDGNEFVTKVLKHSTNISEMFETLTAEELWDFMNYHQLESIIDMYGDHVTTKMMKQYKQSLTGYMLTTAIKDHLDAVDLEHPTRRIQPMPQKELFSKLTCRLGVKITNQSLNYVRRVWKSLEELFSLPKHTLLLHEIAEKCLEIMWQFPSELVAYVIQVAKENKLYFRMRRFLWVSVDGVCIYTESEAQVKHKVGCL